MNWKTLLEDRIKAPVGEEFYVGGAGASDDKSGRIALEPFLRIATALEHCKSGRHDVIWVQDYWENDTFPIVLTKQCVHILGLSTPGINSHWPMMNAGAHPCFQIGTAGSGMCEIAGLSMITDDSHPCIEVVSGECYIWLHHLALGEHGVAQDGILAEGALSELAFSTVEHCLFGKQLARDGIRTGVEYGSLTFSWIMNNIFSKYGGVGINFQQDNPAAQGGGFIGNKFYQKVGGGAAKGWAITIAAAQGTIVDDNHAMESASGGPQNPYLDTTTGETSTTKNAWGLNYRGNVVTYPAVS